MRNRLKAILTNLINWLAKSTIKRFRPVVIAITGSVGKTSTKEAIFAVVSSVKRARCNVGNFNGEYGVPITVLGDWTKDQLKVIGRDSAGEISSMHKVWFFFKLIFISFIRLIFGWRKLYPEVLVLEYGADKPGDINYLTEIVKPDISVITAVGDIPVHVQFYDSPEAVAREKGRLVEALSASGLAVLNADELRVAEMQKKTRATTLTFGFSENSDVRIIDFENKFETHNDILRPVGVVFKLGYDGAFVPVRIAGALGTAQAYSAGAATCVGLAFNLNLVQISDALTYHAPPAGRMQFLKGKQNSIIIDDSYNASPLSMNNAIETAKEIKIKRKIAVVGDMKELVQFSEQAHKTIGANLAKVFDVIIAVGPESIQYAEAGKKAKFAKKNVVHFETVDEALGQLGLLVKPGDLILVKGSHSMNLSKAVEALRE
jgi:UDP-N-acetylmuramoyl-tripeptide--D-alanyl-D-alanine ligase